MWLHSWKKMFGDSKMLKILSILKSIKLAVFLILFLAALSLSGIFLPQIPAEFLASPEGHIWWLENVAAKKYGLFTNFLDSLDVFNIFHSIWFLGAVILLLLNILTCTLFRSRTLLSEAKNVKVPTATEFYTKGKNHYKLTAKLSGEQTYAILDKILQKYRYSLMRADKGENTYVSGNKNRYSVYGTFAVHLSFFVLIIGILTGNYLGFRNDSFVVVEDTAQDIGNQTGLSLYLKSFTDEYWGDGTPKDYRSEVTIFENGHEVKNGVIRVNYPLLYNGVRLQQGFFGPAIKLQISDPDGQIIFNNNVALTGARNSNSLLRPEGSVKLLNGDKVLIIGNSGDGADRSIAENEIGLELYDSEMSFKGWQKLQKDTSGEIGGLKFTFSDIIQYSGFLVSKDPGEIYIWIAAFVFLMGLGMLFYFPHRQVWIALYPAQNAETEILIRLHSNMELGLENEAKKIIADFENMVKVLKK
jgi:cytochrome c biogenesis protein